MSAIGKTARNLVIVVMCAVFVTAAIIYLRHNRLMFYATGSNQRALSKATWLMSVKEVERVNGGQLLVAYAQCLHNPDDHFWDTVTIKTDRRLWVYGQSATVHYFFAQDRLFAYILLLHHFRLRQLDSLVFSDPDNHYPPTSGSRFVADSVHSFYVRTDSTEHFLYGARQDRIASAGIQVQYTPYIETWKSTLARLSTYCLYEPVGMTMEDSLKHWYGYHP